MVLIEEYVVTYIKLPAKKRNISQDGICKITKGNGPNVICCLRDENEIEIAKKTFSSSSFYLEIGSDIEIGHYRVTIFDIFSTFNSQNNSESTQNLKFTKTQTDHSETENCNSSDHFFSNQKPIVEILKPVCNEEKNLISNEYPDECSKLFSSTSKMLLPFIKEKRIEKRISPVYELDIMLRKRMRNHQIEGAEWILKQLDLSKNHCPASVASNGHDQKFSFLDFPTTKISDDDCCSEESDSFLETKPRSSILTSTKSASENISNENVKGVILADEMGLGKTLTSISVIWAYLSLKNGITGSKAIVVCPSSLIDNWQKEFKLWLGLRVSPMCVKPNSKRCPRQVIESFQFSNSPCVLIISYEMYRTHKDTLNKVKRVEIIVCDEGHRLKNVDGTKTIQALSESSANRRLILSGTPIQNDLDELFAMVSFVQPKALGSISSFQYQFSIPISKGNEENASLESKEECLSAIEKLKDILENIVLRRTQAEVLSKFLPPKYEFIINCGLSPVQLTQYKKCCYELLGNLHLSTDSLESSFGDLSTIQKDPYFFIPPKANEKENILDITKKSGSGFILPYLFQLRGICNAAESTQGIMGLKPMTSLKDMLAQSYKLQIIDRIVSISISQNPPEKIVVVSNFLKTVDDISRLANARGWSYSRLDGKTPIDIRQSVVDEFNRKVCGKMVFLISSKAGGVGLNLIGASRLIMCDCDWNPATDNQAMSRVWRDGQTKAVHIYRLVAKDTIEESIIMRQRSKSALAAIMSGFGDIDDDSNLQTQYKRMPLTNTDVINLIQPKFPLKLYSSTSKPFSSAVFSGTTDDDSLVDRNYDKKRKVIIDESESPSSMRSSEIMDLCENEKFDSSIPVGFPSDPVIDHLYDLLKSKVIESFHCAKTNSKLEVEQKDE